MLGCFKELVIYPVHKLFVWYLFCFFSNIWKGYFSFLFSFSLVFLIIHYFFFKLQLLYIMSYVVACSYLSVRCFYHIHLPISCLLFLKIFCWRDVLYDVYCVLYTMWCILCDVSCILYSVYCILYNGYRILYDIFCILYTDFGILYVVLNTEYCILYEEYYIMDTGYYKMYPVYWFLYTV